VLTHEQCIRYRLPRTPIKESEGRARGFEARFGEGATELDALEALHRGELRRILVQEIGRYYDDALDDEVEEVTAQVRADLDDVERTVRAQHADDIAKLEAEQAKIAAKMEEMAKRVAEMEKSLERRARPILRKIKTDLEAEAPNVDDYDWPEPDEGDDNSGPQLGLVISSGNNTPPAERERPEKEGYRATVLSPASCISKQSRRGESRLAAGDHDRLTDGPRVAERKMDMSKRRKRNWNAGMTLEQQAIARDILREHIRAFEDERTRGAFGAPGSIWEIGADGRARLRVPNARD
jgi:hypothetical protein